MTLEYYYNTETNTLTLPRTFNEELTDLPIDTKIIIFEEDTNVSKLSLFNKEVKNLPNTLTHLTFGWEFNQSVDNLPTNLTHLTLGRKFNLPINNLPNNLKELNCNFTFDQPVGHHGCKDNNCPRNLPNSLTHLIFIGKFNQSIDNLPNSLTHLSLSIYFNKPVENLPSSLTYLKFSHYFNQPVDNLPKNLTYLELGCKFKQTLLNLPKTIEELSYCSCSEINEVSPEIENLIINFHDNPRYNKPINNLSSNVKIITINYDSCIYYLKKIPFGCKIMNKQNKEIFVS